MSEIQNQIGGDHYRKMAIAELRGATRPYRGASRLSDGLAGKT